MSLLQEYKQKLVTTDEAVKCVKSGDTINLGAFCGTVYDLEMALARRVDELSDVKAIDTIWPYPHKPFTVQADPESKHFIWQSTQFSALERKINKEGNAWYVPVNFREQPKYYQKSNIDLDVAMLQVAPMDEHGFFNVGPQVADVYAIVQNARTVILEVNEKMPRVYGYGNVVHISEVDYIVHGENRELPELIAKEGTEVERKIAEFIVPRIRSGSSLQLGIGGIPNYVGKLLSQSDLSDFSVHSEMLPDAALDLYNAGKLSGRKKLDPGKITYTFSMGSQMLYKWLDNNPLHWCCPVDYVNEIHTISQLDNFVSICSCLEVDLYGQVNSETAGLQHIGGNGGQLDFVVGSYLSNGGQGFLCTPSVRVDKNGNKKSLIKGMFSAGTIVTVPRQVTQDVVTEYGIASMKGKSTWQRAEALVEIAHPEFRDELIKEAQKMGIWKTSSKITA